MLGIDVQVREHLRRISDRLLAMRADAAHEALGAGENDRRRNQERRDAHVVQARDGAGSVITMHRAQHLVAGERGFDGDFRGFGIANFTDHDDVRVLAQNGAQGIGEGEADFLFHRHLVDAGNLEFDRVFDRDDVVSRDCSVRSARNKAWWFCRNRSGRSPGSDRAAHRRRL